MASRLIASLLVIVLTIGAGATVFWFTMAGDTGRTIGNGDALVVAFVLTAILTTGNLVLRWGRWHFLCRRFDVRVRTRDSLRLYFATLPAIATPFYLGELLRAPLLGGRFPQARPALYVVWLVERLTDATALVVLLLTARQFVPAIALVLVAWGLVLVQIGRLAPGAGGSQIRRPVVLAVLFASSLAAWVLPVSGLQLTLRLLDGPAAFLPAADAVASGALLGGIAGIPLGTGVVGSAAILTLEDRGIPREIAVAATAVFRAATAWYAVGLGCLVLLVTRRHLAALIRSAGPDHFDTLAATYRDQLPAHVRERLLDRKIGMMEPWLERESIRPGARILDVGCGHGWYACELARRGYRVTAFDVSADQIAQARVYAAGAGVSVDFLVLDASALPFAGATFDAAYSVNVLHHILDLDARQRALEEVVRVLRPGGLFFLHEMNTENPLFRFYVGYVYPLVCDIDEGIERWIQPSALPPVSGAAWQPDVDFFTFLPDFTPRPVLEACQGLEEWLERSALRPWSAHYAARLRKLGVRTPRQTVAAPPEVGASPTR